MQIFISSMSKNDENISNSEFIEFMIFKRYALILLNWKYGSLRKVRREYIEKSNTSIFLTIYEIILLRWHSHVPKNIWQISSKYDNSSHQHIHSENGKNFQLFWFVIYLL